MKAFIERVCILFQVIVYGLLGYQYLEEGIYWGGSLDNSDYPLFIGILLFPTIVRWILTGKFQMLPITSDD